MCVQGLEADLFGVFLGLYGRAMLIRAGECRRLGLFAEGKLFGTVPSCIGQEWPHDR